MNGEHFNGWLYPVFQRNVELAKVDRHMFLSVYAEKLQKEYILLCLSEWRIKGGLMSVVLGSVLSQAMQIVLLC